MNTPQLRIIEDIAAIPAAQWNALAGGDPFLSHAYLHALQASGSATPAIGWHAQFLTLWQGADLLGAMPLYLKSNSYGEFVFDWAWADAYRRHGLSYYPKLVCTVPFTPVTGARLLADLPGTRAMLLDAALSFARESGVSSLHCLFPNEADTAMMQAQGMMLRQDVQFHWQNPGYADFDAFLAALSRDKRKRIKQERRKVAAAGIQLRCITGEHATPEQWDFFARCYAHTREQHHSPPALNANFFQRIGATLPHNTLLVIATREGQPVASALNFFTGEVLYGRSWGALEYHPGLHFETCYYQAIEFCIAHKIKTFEGGAQGEHKLARGFLPVATHSAHWLAHPEFSRAVEDFLQRETHAIDQYVDALNERSPFKSA
ncbi:MAG: GNAT family N-acetyltransferase [Sideroxydans sp.]|nr:GNAT family N-acetyltransferase [Sideroxydans sp.]